MLFHATVRAKNEEGILERILRVCRNRGFPSSDVSAAVDHSLKVMSIHIRGSSERSPILLQTQIEKLCDVITVTVESVPARTIASDHSERTDAVRRPIYVI